MMTSYDRKRYRRQLQTILRNRALLDKVAKAYQTSAAHIAVKIQTYLAWLAEPQPPRFPKRA